MAALTFDTLRFTRTLEKAGLPTAQAEAISDAFKDASGEAEIATKRDIEKLESNIKIEQITIKNELFLLKWMLGLVIAGVMSLVLKQFF